MNTSQEWVDYWDELRNRRLLVAFAAATWLVLWIVLGAAGLLAGFLLLLTAYQRLRAWRCPRCRMPIVGSSFTTFINRCRSCDLEVFAHAIYVQTPMDSTNPDAFSLSHRTRRFVAGYEIFAGVSLMILSAFASASWWQILTFEGLAGLSLAAGVWLWRDEARGYALTRTLQIVQLIRLQSPWLTYVATSGFAFYIYHGVDGIRLNPRLEASFALFTMTGQPLGVAVNLWAAALLLVLQHAKPRAEPSSGVRTSETVQEPPSRVMHS